ncbi:MAG: phosphopentomutase [Selenomonadaceae bacterium]|nr:phosphopentomutase [Selenomonadaceae bacterium]
MKRIFFIVLDSFGIGGAKDAAAFSDEGANTLRSVFNTEGFSVPTLEKLGLFHIDGVSESLNYTSKVSPIASYGRMSEASPGKDTTIGHFELMGVISKKPLPVYPNGFPPEIIEKLEKAFNRRLICNKPYSGTEVIKDYGTEHQKTGALIIYTSADSVLQLAAHEDVVSVETLYDYCRKAREIMTGDHAVGRVIARPFTGEYPNFTRTPRRHDFSIMPPEKTILDKLEEKGFDTIGVGKTYDIFAGCGITENFGVNENNADGMKKTSNLLAKDFSGIALINLVDFDMVYGHRRNVKGYAEAIKEFDLWLSGFLPKLQEEDALIITADHGCDPTFRGTDHTRENVPILVYNKNLPPKNLGVSDSFAFASEIVEKLLL